MPSGFHDRSLQMHKVHSSNADAAVSLDGGLKQQLKRHCGAGSHPFVVPQKVDLHAAQLPNKGFEARALRLYRIGTANLHHVQLLHLRDSRPDGPPAAVLAGHLQGGSRGMAQEKESGRMP